MKTCKNCGTEHKGSYGSGRFCTKTCAKAFSTKVKRKEINDKISKTLKGRGNPSLIKTCYHCKKEFEINWPKRHQKFCSLSCSTTSRNLGTRKTKEQKEKIRNSVKQTYIDGKSVYGGKTKWYTYKDIRVQGSYELRACFIFDKWKKEGKIKDWEYTKDRIIYKYEGKSSSYLLDFKVIKNDGGFYYVETKGYQTEKDLIKWAETRNQGFELEVWFNEELTKYEM